MMDACPVVEAMDVLPGSGVDRKARAARKAI